MSQDTATLSGVLTLLGHLAARAPREAFDEPVVRARSDEIDPRARAELERARNLALSVDQRIRDLDRRKNELAMLIDTVRDLAEQQDLEALLTTVVRRSRLLLHLDTAWVALLDPKGGIRVGAADGTISDLNEASHASSWGDLTTLGMVGRAPVWTSDYAGVESVRRLAHTDRVVYQEGLCALIAVPLRVGDRAIGVLYGGDRVSRSFTADEVAMMTSLGDYASSAVERVQARDEARGQLAEMTDEVERLRARERGERRAAGSGSRLLDLVLSGADAHAFAAAAAVELGGSVWLRDENDGTIACSDPQWVADEEKLAEVAFTARAEHRIVRLGNEVTVASFRVGDEDLGALVVRCPDRPRGPDPRVLRHVLQAATVLATLNRGAESVDRRLRDEALEEFINGAPTTKRWQRKLQQRLGLDLSRRHAVIVVKADIRERKRLATWASTFVWLRGGARTVHDGHLIMLLPHDDPGELAREVMQRLGETFGRPEPVGAALTRGGPEGLATAYQEALGCLEALVAFGRQDTAATMDELGFVGMLLGGNPDIVAFIEQRLGPIIRYDEERSTGLAATLEAYFAAGSSPTYAADALQVHPNTVARRLERVSQLLGPKWQQPGPALEIQLALRLRKVTEFLVGRSTVGQSTDSGS
ncbi:helix-turn-helix domain-containing protein [Streptomyces sp. NPDC058576]|uniref:helix-turn-helix domain-containing protein n=1 Tax=Streptomyces sp. NPDC058576 TaxID=3346547 RepID=UPI0036574C7D